MTSVAYLTVDEFKLLTIAPSALVDAIEIVTPGWTANRLLHRSAWLDVRLAKRYDAPFQSPYPDVVRLWLDALVTFDAYHKRGVDPDDLQFRDVAESAKKTEAEVLEAADSDKGLFELPLRANTSANGVTKSFPKGYSEQSPYVWTDVQSETAREEDENGQGS
jgi:hypothetical protein